MDASQTQDKYGRPVGLGLVVCPDQVGLWREFQRFVLFSTCLEVNLLNSSFSTNTTSKACVS